MYHGTPMQVAKLHRPACSINLVFEHIRDGDPARDRFGRVVRLRPYRNSPVMQSLNGLHRKNGVLSSLPSDPARLGTVNSRAPSFLAH